jgi:outer membrane immunogenic protein
MRMRSILLATILTLAGASAAMAQASSANSYSGDAAATIHYVRVNAGPGQCGCFNLWGGGLSGSWNFRGPWSVVSEISAENSSGDPATSSSLTLTSYMAGVRYRLPQPWLEGPHKPQPFAQLLIGGAHAGGGSAGVGDGTYEFASRLGGGVDIPVNSHFSVRLIQIDYYVTRFANQVNDHQNNLLVGAGLVFHWSRPK